MMNPTQNSIGLSNVIEPRHIVPIQLKNFTPVGTAIRNVNVYRSYRYGEITTADDPWGHGNSLGWATSSPPPRHNHNFG
jgi:heme/copper-type cytochrome/quinol oxidase subunit 1